MNSKLRLLIACLACLILSGTAQAQDQAEVARQHYRTGLKLFDEHKFSDAIDEFQAAYEIKPDPAFIYNIAQCHRLAGNSEAAIRYYQTFLDLLPNTPARAKIEGYIAEIRATLATAPVETPPVNQEPVVQQQQPPPDTSNPFGESTSEKSLTLKIKPYIPAIAVFSVSVVSAVLGLGFGLGAQVEAKKINSTGTIDNPAPYAQVAGNAANGETYATLAYVFLGVAGAAALTGTALALWAAYGSKEHAAQKISLVPSFASDGKSAAAGIMGRW